MPEAPWNGAASVPDDIGLTLFLSVALAFFLSAIWSHFTRKRRLTFIREGPFPPGLEDKLLARRPELGRDDARLVAQGLRQFFMAYLEGRRKHVSMPSRVVDDLWHEFIVHTRDYEAFCQRAFGGFLHHNPAVALTPLPRLSRMAKFLTSGSPRRTSNEGLRRVWWHCCKFEGVDPKNPSHLPLLFALDADLNIADGFRYVIGSDDDRPTSQTEPWAAVSVGVGVYVAVDFSSDDFDGTTDGFGDGGGGDGGGDGGGGCGGD